MQNVARELRSDFTAAISPNQSDVTLDPSEPIFLGPFSIYSRGHLRKMDEFLSHISNARLKNDPAEVALAVDSILQLFDKLEITVEQSAASDKRIDAGRSR